MSAWNWRVTKIEPLVREMQGIEFLRDL